MTPNQLFTAGTLRLRHSGLAAVDFFDSVPDDYGTEEDGVSPDNSEGVQPVFIFQMNSFNYFKIV